MLFSSWEISAKKTRPIDKDRRRVILPTGAPRLVESSTSRQVRADVEAWIALLEAVRRSAQARLMLLDGRDGKDLIACPWGRLLPCAEGCRCVGRKLVTVAFLREHYMHLVTEVVRLVRPS